MADPGQTNSGDIGVLGTIDSFVEEHGTRVDFIKMDIEGAELNALYGAVETLKSQKPMLAICIYHNDGEDLLTIPLFLANLNLGYKFYVRKYYISRTETVLCAMAE